MSEIIIPLHGLSKGSQEFEFKLDDRFLDEFGNGVVNGVDGAAHFAVERKGSWIEIVCAVEGEAKVECDRCLEDLYLPVDTEQKLTVRFDADPEEVVNDDDNTIILVDGTSEIDLGQTVYDFICLSLPLQKVHPEGECNMETVSKIGIDSSMEGQIPANTPFSGLKDLLKESN